MFYLGQTVINKPYVSAKQRAAIISGYTEDASPLITFIDPSGELKIHDKSWNVDLHPIRKKDAKSPTGFSIYKGNFFKFGFIGPVKLRLGPEDEIIKELKKAQKIIDG